MLAPQSIQTLGDVMGMDQPLHRPTADTADQDIKMYRADFTRN
ncbi:MULTISPECIES: hypothetical protein [unclassified Polynucleobacter]|nr:MULTISPECIES: hypothetical protein [unclassified Polynucleobacter]